MDLRVELNRYLQIIRENLRMDPASEKEIIREIETHVEDRCQEMQNTGASEDEAIERALRLLGSAKVVAHQIYETHSQGTWRQALLAGMPHLFFAALFTLNWLAGIAWVPIMLTFVAIIVLYALFHGKPAWLFPWLGYALLPVVAAGVSLVYLPKGWPWVTLLFYVPLILWLSCFITIKFIRRDWLYSTLMLLPVPTFIAWLLASGQMNVFRDFKPDILRTFAPWTGLTFLVLGISVAFIVRMKSRALRIASLTVSGLTSTAMVTLTSNRLGFAAFLGLTVLMLIFMAVPAYIERRVQSKRPMATP